MNSILGTSGISALQLFIEIGRVDRFLNKRKVVAWAGFCPRVSSPGGKTFRGRIAKRGNTHVRRILFQAAIASLRTKNDKVTDMFDIIYSIILSLPLRRKNAELYQFYQQL